MPDQAALAPGVHNEWIRAWVIFERGTQRRPWSCFCPRFGHCWVMWSRFWPEPSLLATEIAMKAEHNMGGLYCDVAPFTPGQIAESLIEHSPPGELLRLDLLVQRNRMRYFGPLNCVTAIKAVLDIDAPWCLTPDQLHRRLIAMGANSLMEGLTDDR